MDIELSFASSISEAYERKRRAFMETVHAHRAIVNRPPSIRFIGMNRQTFYAIEFRRHVFNRAK